MLCCVSAAELDMDWVNPWVRLDGFLFNLIVVQFIVCIFEKLTHLRVSVE